jgi:hypothetical protein
MPQNYIASLTLLCWLALLLSGGCKSLRPNLGTYRYGTTDTSLLPQDSPLSPPVLIGGPLPAMDRWESLLHRPSITLKQWQKELANRRLLPASSTEETTQQEALLAAIAYLEENDLHQVIVEAHHYDPLEQWKRLQANNDIHPLWKYTDGAARICTYTLFPARVFRLDTFNPYTRTLSINSDKPASAIYEAAKAKHFAKAPWPGAYAATRYIPFAPLGQQVVVSKDALHYAQTREDKELSNAMMVHTYSTLAGSAFLGGSTLIPQINDVPFVAAPVARITGSTTGAIAGRLMSEPTSDTSKNNLQTSRPEAIEYDQNIPQNRSPSRLATRPNPSEGTFR